MTVYIHGIPAGDAWEVWSVVRNWISDACETAGGLFTADTILQEIERQEQQLWVIAVGDNPCAAVTTRIEVHPTGLRVLEIGVVGGHHMELWVKALSDHLKAYARDLECVSVRSTGRKGWSRVLRNIGWKEEAVTVTLRI